MKQEKKYNKGFLLRSIIAAVLVTAVVLACAAWLFLGESGRTLVMADYYVKNRYVGPYEQEQWLDSTLGGMINGLDDRWSYYSNAAYYAKQQDSKDGSFVGIGVTVSYADERGIYIESVVEGGPAEEAGLLAGELIVGVEGEAVTQENMLKLSNNISGEAGSVVSLGILAADGTERTVSITRARIEAHPVNAYMEGTIGVLRYSNFYLNSSTFFIEAVEQLQEQGAQGIVFDLRGNPGGYLTDLLKILDFLLPEGPIFQSVSYTGRETTTYSDAESVDLPFVVLVDENSYSAAEFFAAQLRESVGTLIVGAQTSGKGYSQQPFALPNGGALNLSSAEYRTGNGTSLAQQGGLTPDYPVENTQEDLQMEKAMEIIQALATENY